MPKKRGVSVALIFFGNTPCELCREAVHERDDSVGFPAFVLNESDLIFPFSDSVTHKKCLLDSPIGTLAFRELQTYLAKTGPGNRDCCVCGQPILEYSQHLAIGHLTSDSQNPLFKFNHLHFHKGHLKNWTHLDSFKTYC